MASCPEMYMVYFMASLKELADEEEFGPAGDAVISTMPIRAGPSETIFNYHDCEEWLPEKYINHEQLLHLHRILRHYISVGIKYYCDYYLDLFFLSLILPYGGEKNRKHHFFDLIEYDIDAEDLSNPMVKVFTTKVHLAPALFEVFVENIGHILERAKEDEEHIIHYLEREYDS